jgi:hypothetical protein
MGPVPEGGKSNVEKSANALPTTANRDNAPQKIASTKRSAAWLVPRPRSPLETPIHAA